MKQIEKRVELELSCLKNECYKKIINLSLAICMSKEINYLLELKYIYFNEKGYIGKFLCNKKYIEFLEFKEYIIGELRILDNAVQGKQYIEEGATLNE